SAIKPVPSSAPSARPRPRCAPTMSILLSCATRLRLPPARSRLNSAILMRNRFAGSQRPPLIYDTDTHVFDLEDWMYAPPGVKTNHNEFPISDRQRAWVLGNPGQLSLTEKPVPVPKKAEVLVRIDAVAICATDLEIIYNGPPASIQGGLPFNKGFTPGHEYMGTVVALGPGVDEYKIGTRVAVEIHAGCGQCKRCREGMYTSCHNYGLNYGDVDK